MIQIKLYIQFYLIMDLNYYSIFSHKLNMDKYSIFSQRKRTCIETLNIIDGLVNYHYQHLVLVEVYDTGVDELNPITSKLILQKYWNMQTRILEGIGVSSQKKEEEYNIKMFKNMNSIRKEFIINNITKFTGTTNYRYYWFVNIENELFGFNEKLTVYHEYIQGKNPGKVIKFKILSEKIYSLEKKNEEGLVSENVTPADLKEFLTVLTNLVTEDYAEKKVFRNQVKKFSGKSFQEDYDLDQVTISGIK